MRKANLFSLLVLSFCLYSCGGDSGDEQTPDQPVPVTQDRVAEVRGDWSANVVETKRNGCEGLATQDNEFSLFIDQSGSSLTIASKRICELGGTQTGQATADAFTAQGQRVFDCGKGRQALLKKTTEFSGIVGENAKDVVLTTEVGCPDAYCFFEQRGTARRVSRTPTSCEGPASAVLPVSTPTLRPTATPQPTATPRPCPCSVQGCCSQHGGVVACSADGTVFCADNTTSPTCHC